MEKPGLREGQTCRATYNESSAEAESASCADGKAMAASAIGRAHRVSSSFVVGSGRPRPVRTREEHDSNPPTWWEYLNTSTYFTRTSHTLHKRFTSASQTLHTLHNNLNFSPYFTHTSRASHLLQHCSAVVEDVRYSHQVGGLNGSV